MKDKDKLSQSQRSKEHSKLLKKGGSTQDSKTKVNGDSAAPSALDKYLFTEEDDDSDRQRMKRLVHNTSEKKRKDKIRIGIVRIGEILPAAYHSHKETSCQILEKAVDYIKDLTEQTDRLLIGSKDEAQALEIQRLRNELEQAQAEKEKYRMLLERAGVPLDLDPAKVLDWKGKDSSSKGMLRRLGLAKDAPTVHAEDGAADTAPVTTDGEVDESISQESESEDPTAGKKLSPKPKRRRNNANHIKEHFARLDSEAQEEEGPKDAFAPFPPGVDPLGMQFGAVPQLGFPAPAIPNSGAQGAVNYPSAPFQAGGVPVLGPNGNFLFVSPNGGQQWPCSTPEGAANATDLAATSESAKTEAEPSSALSSSVPQETGKKAVGAKQEPAAEARKGEPDGPAVQTQPPDATAQSSQPEAASLESASVTGEGGTRQQQSDQTSMTTLTASNDSGTTTTTSTLLPQTLTPAPTMAPVPAQPTVMGQVGQPPVGQPQVASFTGPVVNPTPTQGNANLQGTLVVQNGQLILIPNEPAANQAISKVPEVKPVMGSTDATSNLAPVLPPGMMPSVVKPLVGQPQIQQPPPVVVNNSIVGGGLVQQPASSQVTVNTPQGVLTTTPTQPNQLPAALILPNGQIVPVVTQPNLMYPQQCTPVTNSLLMGAAGSTQNVVAPQKVVPASAAMVKPVFSSQARPTGLLITTAASLTTQTTVVPSSVGTMRTVVPQAGTVQMNPLPVGQPMVQMASRPPLVRPGAGVQPQAQVPVGQPRVSLPTSSASSTPAPGSGTPGPGSSKVTPGPVAAMLTPDGNIILTIPPGTNPSTLQFDPSKAAPGTGPGAAASKSQSKKTQQRTLMPKPSAATTKASASTSSSSSSQAESSWRQNMLSPTTSTSAKSPVMSPLTVATTSSMDATTTSNAGSSATDILAKAAESIFSSSPNDVSPPISSFYNPANEDNPLHIDTSEIDPEDSIVTSSQASPGKAASKAKPKSKVKPSRAKKKAKGSEQSSASFGEMVINLNSNTESVKQPGGPLIVTGDANVQHQLVPVGQNTGTFQQPDAEVHNEEEDEVSDISEFADLIRLQDPSMLEVKPAKGGKKATKVKSESSKQEKAEAKPEQVAGASPQDTADAESALPDGGMPAATFADLGFTLPDPPLESQGQGQSPSTAEKQTTPSSTPAAESDEAGNKPKKSKKNKSGKSSKSKSKGSKSSSESATTGATITTTSEPAVAPSPLQTQQQPAGDQSQKAAVTSPRKSTAKAGMPSHTDAIKSNGMAPVSSDLPVTSQPSKETKKSKSRSKKSKKANASTAADTAAATAPEKDICVAKENKKPAEPEPVTEAAPVVSKELCTADRIPDTITFMESELSDVLDQVESLNESLPKPLVEPETQPALDSAPTAKSKKMSRSRKSKHKAATEPEVEAAPPKRRRTSSETLSDPVPSTTLPVRSMAPSGNNATFSKPALGSPTATPKSKRHKAKHRDNKKPEPPVEKLSSVDVFEFGASDDEADKEPEAFVPSRVKSQAQKVSPIRTPKRLPVRDDMMAMDSSSGLQGNVLNTPQHVRGISPPRTLETPQHNLSSLSPTRTLHTPQHSRAVSPAKGLFDSNLDTPLSLSVLTGSGQDSKSVSPSEAAPKGSENGDTSDSLCHNLDLLSDMAAQVTTAISEEADERNKGITSKARDAAAAAAAAAMEADDNACSEVLDQSLDMSKGVEPTSADAPSRTPESSPSSKAGEAAPARHSHIANLAQYVAPPPLLAMAPQVRSTCTPQRSAPSTQDSKVEAVRPDMADKFPEPSLDIPPLTLNSPAPSDAKQAAQKKPSSNMFEESQPQADSMTVPTPKSTQLEQHSSSSASGSLSPSSLGYSAESLLSPSKPAGLKSTSEAHGSTASSPKRQRQTSDKGHLNKQPSVPCTEPTSNYRQPDAFMASPGRSSSSHNANVNKDYFTAPRISTFNCSGPSGRQGPDQYNFSPSFPASSFPGGSQPPSTNVLSSFTLPSTTGTNTFSFTLSSTSNCTTTTSSGVYSAPAQGGSRQFAPFYGLPPVGQGQRQGQTQGQGQGQGQNQGQVVPALDLPSFGMDSAGGQARGSGSSLNSESRSQSKTPPNGSRQNYGNFLPEPQRQQPPHPRDPSPFDSQQRLSHPKTTDACSRNAPASSASCMSAATSSCASSQSIGTSLGRGPEANAFFPTPFAGSVPGPGQSLTSPPLHHPGPPQSRDTSTSGRSHQLPFDAAFSNTPQYPGMSPFGGPGYELSPLSFSRSGSNTSGSSRTDMFPHPGSVQKDLGRAVEDSRNVKSMSGGEQSQQPSRQQSRQQQQHMPSQQQQHQQSHHSSHHASQQSSRQQQPQQQQPQQPQQQQQTHHHQQQQKSSQSSRPSSSSSSSKSKKSKPQQQHQQYNMDATMNTMFDANRSTTPYFPISNLSPQPRNFQTDGPTYLSGHFFNTGRPLSNTNPLQHKNPSDMNPFNPLFPPSRAQNGLFQPGFGVNPPVHPGNHPSSSSQITPHTNTMANFNFNLFGDMNNASQGDGLNISPIKFPHSNPILPTQPGMEHNSLQHHQSGNLYQHRPQMAPPMLHNMSINSLLGHQHPGFEGRAMAPGINSTMGAHFGGHGHAASFGMTPLNFPMHEH